MTGGEHGLWSSFWVRISALPLIGQMSLNELFSKSIPQRPHQYNIHKTHVK